MRRSQHFFSQAKKNINKWGCFFQEEKIVFFSQQKMTQQKQAK